MNSASSASTPHLHLVSKQERGSDHPAPGVTLVLGSGGARGLAHIGVLLALEHLKIPVRAVVGCSIGAEIGALYCAGWNAERLVVEAAKTRKWHTFGFFAPWPFGGGLVWNRGVERFLKARLGDKRIEHFETPFSAVACDLQSGEEAVIDSGPAWSAVRASIAIPGLLSPHTHGNYEALSDGALVNPIPVSTARKRYPWPVVAVQVQRPPGIQSAQARRLRSPLGWARVVRLSNENMHWEISQWQLRHNPPDLLITPDLCGFVDCFDYHQGGTAITRGYQATLMHSAQLASLLSKEDRG